MQEGTDVQLGQTILDETHHTCNSHVRVPKEHDAEMPCRNLLSAAQLYLDSRLDMF